MYVASRSGYRVTLLPGDILSARRILLLVTGENKRETLKQVVSASYEPSALPATLFDREEKNVVWFLDRVAAEGLT